MKIAAISDIHGHLPEIPDCDVLCIAGDIGWGQRPGSHGWNKDVGWWVESFGIWLAELAQRGIVTIACAGNHDFVLEEIPALGKALPWVYLCDEAYEYKGVKFYGTPWQPWFGGWAFNSPEDDRKEGEPFLHSKFKLIPDDIDVLISHGPPLGINDKVNGMHAGSQALSHALERVKPKLAVHGHIHVGRGLTNVEGVMCANVAHVGQDYKGVNPPMVFEI